MTCRIWTNLPPGCCLVFEYCVVRGNTGGVDGGCLFPAGFYRVACQPRPGGLACASGISPWDGGSRHPQERFPGHGDALGIRGPVALNESAFWRGLGLWRQRQTDNNRIAEFVRLHPFLNPMRFRGWFDHLRFDRLTVLVDLRQPESARWRSYSKGTRYSIRQAQRKLSFRRLVPGRARFSAAATKQDWSITGLNLNIISVRITMMRFSRRPGRPPGLPSMAVNRSRWRVSSRAAPCPLSSFGRRWTRTRNVRPLRSARSRD